MSNLNAQGKLYGKMREVHGELLRDTLEERGRGFASDGEAWASIKESLENIEARMKSIKDLHKDMWSAVKDRNEDAFCALADEFQRSALLLSMEWATTGVMANISVLGVEG